MYEFNRIHHPAILTHTVLIGLTPLIPIPILDDVIKSALQRRLVRQIAAAHGQNPTSAEIDALLEEGLGGCIGGCAYTLFVYPVKELASKVFIFLEWRRALNLVSHTYYFYFLLDASLMDGYQLSGPAEKPAWNAARLRWAIETARQGANVNLIKSIFRQSLRPGVLMGGIWALVTNAIGQIPGLFGALGAAFRKARADVAATPGRIRRGIFGRAGGVFRGTRSGFYDSVQARMGSNRPPGLSAAERIANRMQELILKLPPDHFDALHQRLHDALYGAGAVNPASAIQRAGAIDRTGANQGDTHEGG